MNGERWKDEMLAWWSGLQTPTPGVGLIAAGILASSVQPADAGCLHSDIREGHRHPFYLCIFGAKCVFVSVDIIKKVRDGTFKFLSLPTLTILLCLIWLEQKMCLYKLHCFCSPPPPPGIHFVQSNVHLRHICPQPLWWAQFENHQNRMCINENGRRKVEWRRLW